MTHTHRHKPVTLTIPEDLIQAAKTLGLNASKAATEGLQAAVRKAQAQAWLADNKNAIDAHNAYVEKNGIPLRPLWDDDPV